MSELINNSDYRKEKLKELILKLHKGGSAEQVKKELEHTLKSIPYGEVVEVEQELIEEGLPEEEVLKLCDVHGRVLDGNIDLSGVEKIPEGHPVDVFQKENQALIEVCKKTHDLLSSVSRQDDSTFHDFLLSLQQCFNDLMDVDKHYQRKEYLLFPYLEQRGITGPPKVMWGKHDEIRDQLKGCLEALRTPDLSKEDLEASLDFAVFSCREGC